METKDYKVLTVPAGRALEHLTEHNVYSCPVNWPQHSSDVVVFAPRDSEGKMRSVYLIKERIIADPNQLNFHPATSLEMIDAVRGYVCAVRHIAGMLDSGGLYRFYFLEDFQDGTVPGQPKLDSPGPVHGYVSLRVLLSGATVVNLLERCA